MSSYLIFAFSLVLFVYWFHYHCRMVLNAKPARLYAAQVAEANSLGFPEIRERLQFACTQTQLEACRSALLHDYRLLTCLLRYTAAFEAAGFTVDHRMLMFDFRLLLGWYRVTLRVAPGFARRTLDECSRIVAHFAEALGERTALAR